MDSSIRFTTRDVAAFVEKHGANRFNALARVLSKNQPYVDALGSEIGQTLLKDMAQQSDVLLEKIIQEESTEEDRAEYRVLRKLMSSYANNILAFYKAAKEIGG